MIRKENYYRSREWLDAVRKLDCCVLCGKYGVQAAHMNQGKGMGMKQHDCLTAALCPECHHAIDNGKDMTRDERRDAMRDAVLETWVQMAKMGLITPSSRARV